MGAKFVHGIVLKRKMKQVTSEICSVISLTVPWESIMYSDETLIQGDASPVKIC